MEFVAVTGRFQPVHLDHLDLMRMALGLGDVLIVGITNPDVRSLVKHDASGHRHRDDANPFSYFERAQWIRDSLLAASVSAQRFTIVPFPLEQPQLWLNYIPEGTTQLVRVYSEWESAKAEALAAVYPTQVLQGDPEVKIAATAIRSGIAAGTSDWQALVPAPVARALS